MKGKRFRDKVLALVADIRIYPGGLILWGDSHYKIKGPHEREILGLLQKGDVLLRRFDHYLGSLALPGYWSHAAIYVGSNKVIHMLGEGITKEDILTFMRTDDICILRSIDRPRIDKAIAEAERQFALGVEYDYDFSTSKKKFYCSEFVDYIYGGFTYKQKPKRWIYPNAIRHVSDLHYIWSRNKSQ